MTDLEVVEICAGAGGQAHGLHRAGFRHALAVELDVQAAATLEANSNWRVAVGDVADPAVWDPSEFEGVALLAGGVPCPPFSMAGKQLGSADERDLFAWAVEQVGIVKPRALMLENVRGLAAPRFAAYRQHVLDRLAQFGYVGDWRLLTAADFGLPQLRPRFVLVAMKPEDAAYFRWPEPFGKQVTVGEAIGDLMAENGWLHAREWASFASGIAPTLVGGSKKHGGADLGPTRAKLAWSKLGVDGRGIAEEAPGPHAPHFALRAPRLTIPMVARLQGWGSDSGWVFTGRKTSQYRQIGNAFPPPVAEAVGRAIKSALLHEGTPHELPELVSDLQDPIYRELSRAADFVSLDRLVAAMTVGTESLVQRQLAVLARDFELEEMPGDKGPMYRLGGFKGFTGESSHPRNKYIVQHRNRVS